VPGRRVGLHAPADLEAVEVRHVQTQNQQVRMEAAQLQARHGRWAAHRFALLRCFLPRQTLAIQIPQFKQDFSQQ
jgi:hypothetical protein